MLKNILPDNGKISRQGNLKLYTLTNSKKKLKEAGFKVEIKGSGERGKKR
jgi:hypothetical protein